MAKSVRMCPLCSGRGKIIETREVGGIIRRRLECGRHHRFTTVELRPQSTPKRALTALLRQLAA